jgi:histidinol-phosphatase (PHP family)
VQKWDGHTHTQFCKHGNGEHLVRYLNRALELGFTKYTVTEHPPLPEGWLQDKDIARTLAMPMEELQPYLDHVWSLKETYQTRGLQVQVGLELDYLQGAESFTWALLEHAHDRIEEAIISVHYLPGRGGMRCIDLSPEDFHEGILTYYGTMDNVLSEYYHHVAQAILFAAKLPIPTRIGHINLIRKFAQALPEFSVDIMTQRLAQIKQLLHATGVGVDVNTAGLRKPTCQEPYVPEWFVRQCIADGIECVFGSDAHSPSDVGAGWDWFAQCVTTSVPGESEASAETSSRG